MVSFYYLLKSFSPLFAPYFRSNNSDYRHHEDQSSDPRTKQISIVHSTIGRKPRCLRTGGAALLFITLDIDIIYDCALHLDMLHDLHKDTRVRKMLEYGGTPR